MLCARADPEAEVRAKEARLAAAAAQHCHDVADRKLQEVVADLGVDLARLEVRAPPKVAPFKPTLQLLQHDCYPR